VTERLTVREAPTAEPLLDAKQAGALLNVSVSWVLAEARVDRIPHIRLGRYVRFDRDELELWWRARLRGPRMDRRNGGPAAQQRPGP
jgi:excisionase family DNA binding protein